MRWAHLLLLKVVRTTRSKSLSVGVINRPKLNINTKYFRHFKMCVYNYAVINYIYSYHQGSF